MTATVSAETQHATPDYWEDQGRLLAPALADRATAVIIGSDADHAARVAVGIARATCERRHVALGDLVGDLAPLYAVAGGADAFGLSDCFREGRSLNDAARPAPDCDALFILPAGTPPVATYDLLAHERWPRLIKGFAEAGALLLLVALPDSPGIETLARSAGGVVAVDMPALRLSRFEVLASVGKPPARAQSTDAARPARSPRTRWIVVGAIVLALAATLAVVFASRRGGAATDKGSGARNSPSPVAPAGTATPTAGVAPVPDRADTIRLGAVVNPVDSIAAATFAVELVAANSVAGANSVLLESEDAAAPADRRTAAVVPVSLGGTAVWYKAVVGAWRTRASADSLLNELRARGIVRRDAGQVVRVPYAFLLQGDVLRSRADIVVDSWRTRGIAAYALLQDDGSVRVFAGAFATPAQAAPLAASIRDAGSPPVLAFRTGRAF